MSVESQTIRILIAEHQNIKEQLKRAGEAITDWQQTLESEISNQHGSQMEVLTDKQWKLAQAIGFLGDGLFSHYQREQNEIGSFVGVLNEAFVVEHSEIIEQLQRINLLLTDTNLKDSTGAELAEKYHSLKRDLEATYRQIADHSSAEDIILQLLLKAITHTDVNKEHS